MGGALILDGHSRAAIEATQALGREGIGVIVSAEVPEAIAFKSRYARIKLSQPPVIPAQRFLCWLEQLDAQNHFDLIIPCTENSLQAFLEVPQEHRLHRITVLPSNLSLRIALDKNLTREQAIQLDVPVPATRVIRALTEVEAATRFPLVLKPLRSKTAEGGEMKTFQPAIVEDEGARRSVLLDWLPRMTVLEQEYVSGWGVGIEMLYREGKLVWYFAHERLHEWPLTGGASTYRRAIEPPREMFDASQRLLDSLNWHGVAMVEFKRSEDGRMALMEVNPRLWGSLALSIASGVNFPLGLWLIATGRQLPSQPAFRRGMRMRHLSADFQWLKANLVASRGNPLLLTRPRVSSLMELGLPLVGQEHWDHFDWKDPGPAAYEIAQLLRDASRATRYRWKVKRLLLRRRRVLSQAAAHVRAVRAVRSPSLLFVCQANICRSPFAAAVATRKLPDFRIDSAGLDRRAGRHTPPNIAEEAERLGLGMAGYLSIPLTAEHMRRADLVFVMEFQQLEHLAKQFPGSAGRIIPLGLFASDPTVDIEDPNRKDAATTKRVMMQIVSAVEGLAMSIGSPAARADMEHIDPTMS